MSFSSDSILKHLDESDYPLLNANYDIAAVRVVGFCSQEKWAIIFELLMSYPASDGIGLMLFVYGTGLKVKQGFETPVLHVPLEWRRYEIQDDELDEKGIPFIPEVIQVHIRGKLITVHTNDVIRLNKAPEFDFDLLVHLIEIYGEELFSTNKELYLYVSEELEKLIQFDNWHHEDNWHHGEGVGVWEGDKFHIPSYTSGVKIIAQILETRNFDLYRSQSVRNLGFDWKVFT
ncbi:MAG: hypothetical protein MUD14_13780 [Hydrococcus sp. Prado102]|jgi:hypothetical protein|nr:hypothetical protein [Hydrococcus sp. Prado102]